MKTTNISYAKAHLSEVVRMVKEGENVLLTERNKAVAMLVPVDAAAHGAEEDWVQVQYRRGIARPPLRKLDLKAFANMPSGPGNASRSLIEEREEGW